MYKDRIVLGSGDLFCMLFSGTIPEDATIETDENQLGEISGGATLEYTIELNKERKYKDFINFDSCFLYNPTVRNSIRLKVVLGINLSDNVKGVIP